MRPVTESCYYRSGSFWLLMSLCFLAFLKGLYLEAPGIKQELPVLAVNSEFHSSLESALCRQKSHSYTISQR